MTPTTPTITMRLDPESLALCAALEQKLGQTRTAIVKLAIRRLAELEHVSAEVEPTSRKREDGR